MTTPEGQLRTQFAELFDAAYDAVLRYARHHVGSMDAEDIVSETFLIAWRRRFDIPHDSTPWLIGVARNLLFQKFRADRRWGALMTELQTTPEEGLEAGEQDQFVERHHVLTALAGLSEQDRELLILTGWDGFTPRQAAAVLDCAASTARVRLHRARRRFADLLAQADGQVTCQKQPQHSPQQEKR